jgi:hypothetical protein
MHFEWEFRRLTRRHAELLGYYARAVAALEIDSYNRSRSHPIQKLENVPAGEAQYSVRLARFHFR